MSITDQPAGSNGPYGTAAVRARHKANTDQRSAVADPQAREARIAELRRQYLAGTYHVDSAELSVAIVRHHLSDEAL